MSTMAQHAALNYHRFGVLRTITAFFMAIVLFIGSTSFFLYRALAQQLKDNVVDLTQLQDSTVDQKGLIGDDLFKGRPVNILISGIDSRYNQGVNSHGDPEEFTTIFSDTTMVMHISADRSRITTVSIPRDLMVWLPSCIDADGNETGESFTQFNQAFRRGAVTDSIPHGIQCTKKAVEQVSGLTIDAFVLVDFTGFVGLVNALGGVWYDVEERIDDPQADADLMPGCQLLNGAQALSYARTRKSIGDGSDLGRIGRQQKLVAAMIREALSKNYVTDFPALYNFIQQGISAVKVSPNLGNLNSDVSLLLSISSINTDDIHFITLPNAPYPEDPNRVTTIDDAADQVWQALLLDRPLPADFEVTTGQGTKALITTDEAQSDIRLVPTEPETLEDEPSTDTEAATTLNESPTQAPPAPAAPVQCPPQ